MVDEPIEVTIQMRADTAHFEAHCVLSRILSISDPPRAVDKPNPTPAQPRTPLGLGVELYFSNFSSGRPKTARDFWKNGQGTSRSIQKVYMFIYFF